MSYTTPLLVNGTTVFGGNTNEKPLWWHGESVHSVCAISPRNSPVAARAATAAKSAGKGALRAVGVLVLRTYPWYAFTSAKPIVLLIPSVKSAGRREPLTAMAPLPP